MHTYWFGYEQKSKIISEIRDPKLNKYLCEIVLAHMMYGPCARSFNLNVPCLKNNVCCKRFPRDIQTGGDGNHLYRRRQPADGGFTAKIGQHDIDKRWIVIFFLHLLSPFNFMKLLGHSGQ